MKRILTLLLMLVLLLSACSPAAEAAPTAQPPAETQADSAPEESASPTAAPSLPSETPPPARSASFTELTGSVEARPSASADFAPAALGGSLYTGAEVRTGEDGKARLDLLPEGTIVRVVPNSSFTVTDLAGDATAPASKLQLFFGKIFILLKGGELEVETPTGVASVRGSLLGLSYDPETNTITATCLEGHCGLGNEEGMIEMTDGQAADIVDGDLSDEARFMTADELSDWLEEAPETTEFIDELPDLPDETAPDDGGTTDGGDTSGGGE